IVSPVGNETANVRSVQISPVALRFETEHPAGALPAVTNLTANHSAGRIVTTFTGGHDSCAEEVRNVPAFVARSPTAVSADIEAAPVVDRSHHRRWRLGVGTCSHIGSRRGGDDTCCKANCGQQKLLHRVFSIPSLVICPARAIADKLSRMLNSRFRQRPYAICSSTTVPKLQLIVFQL